MTATTTMIATAKSCTLKNHILIYLIYKYRVELHIFGGFLDDENVSASLTLDLLGKSTVEIECVWFCPSKAEREVYTYVPNSTSVQASQNKMRGWPNLHI